MKIIAHRGLVDGPNKKLENEPSSIMIALDMGFDVEIDVNYCNKRWMLGHDAPVHPVDIEFLLQPGLWLHVKNLAAMLALSTYDVNYFWHQEDDYTLTSKGYIWTYPGKQLTHKSVCVLPEWQDTKLINLPKHCYGICSDYVSDAAFQKFYK